MKKQKVLRIEIAWDDGENVMHERLKFVSESIGPTLSIMEGRAELKVGGSLLCTADIVKSKFEAQP